LETPVLINIFTLKYTEFSASLDQLITADQVIPGSTDPWLPRDASDR